MKSTRWHALMNRLGFGANTETYRALLDAYSQKHRHYHTAVHIAHCLDELAPCRELAEHPDDVELALWFHDAVYDSYAKDNEQKSADWAARFLREKRAGSEQVDRVHGLVMATVHEAPADGVPHVARCHDRNAVECHGGGPRSRFSPCAIVARTLAHR